MSKYGFCIALAALSASIALVVPASAAEPNLPTYVLSMTLKDGDRVVGNPRLSALAGKPAVIEIGEANGNHYSLRVIMTPQAASVVCVAATINVQSVQQGHRKVQPYLSVTLGQNSTIMFGEESAVAKPFRVEFKVDLAKPFSPLS